MADERIKGRWVGTGKVYHRNTTDGEGNIVMGRRVAEGEAFTMPEPLAYASWLTGDFVPKSKSVVQDFEKRRAAEEAERLAQKAGLGKVDLVARLEALVEADPAARDRLRLLLLGEPEPVKGKGDK